MEAIDFQSDVVIPRPPPSGQEVGFDVLLAAVEDAEVLLIGTDGLISHAKESVGTANQASALLRARAEVGQSPAPRQQFLNVKQLCAQLNVSPSWVYKRTKKGALDPLPVARIGGLKFDAE